MNYLPKQDDTESFTDFFPCRPQLRKSITEHMEEIERETGIDVSEMSLSANREGNILRELVNESGKKVFIVYKPSRYIIYDRDNRLLYQWPRNYEPDREEIRQIVSNITEAG